MIRKHIRLSVPDNRLLGRLSKKLQLSESDIVRRALPLLARDAGVAAPRGSTRPLELSGGAS